MQIDRILVRSVSIPLAFLALCFTPSYAAPSPDSLRLDKTSSQVVLSWQAGTGPYGVYRAGQPATLGDVASYHILTETLTYDEDLPSESDSIYYLVDDPPHCGVGPCTGALNKLDDIALPPGATARRAIDDGQFAYVASGMEGLTILDIADPTAVGTLGNWTEAGVGDCNDIVKVGNYVFLACDPSGIKGVGVSDPLIPTLAATLPTAGAVSVGARGDALYVGVGSTVEIWDVSTPTAPIFSGVRDPGMPDPLARVWVDGDRLYCLFADGAITIYDTSSPLAPVELNSFATAQFAVDFTVRDGIAYCGYLGAGVRIYDLRDPLSPTLLWSDGGAEAVAVTVRGRTAVCAYADGRVLTLGLRDRNSPQVVSAAISTSTPTGVALFGNGVALCGYGPSAGTIDIPPFVISQSPRSGSTGMCEANSEVLLRFSSSIDASSVDADSVSVTQAGNLVDGSHATDGPEVIFTPDPGGLTLGTHEVTVNDSIRNVRGTAGPLSGYLGTFTIAPGCTEWTSVPASVIGGMPASLQFQIFGSSPDLPEVLISTDVDPADPFAISETVPAGGGPTTFAAQWVAPIVDVPTTYYVIVRAEIDGDVAYGPIETITVDP